MDYLFSRKDMRVLGPCAPDARLPTVAVDCARTGCDIAKALSAHKVAAAGGDFYSARLVNKMRARPLRLPFVHYTSPGEVDQAIRALDAAR